MSSREVTIIGAGLVGSLLAVMLRQKGFKVSIIEKRADMRQEGADSGRSINLVVTSRGINALKSVQLWEKVQEIVVPVHGRMMHSRAGDLTYQPYGRDQTECNFSVSRSGINKLLMSEAEKLGVDIQFEQALSSIDLAHKKLVYEDGSERSYDLLFGTDGGGSVVRRDLIQFVGGEEETHRFSGDYKEMLMPSSEDGSYPIEKNVLHIWPRGAEMLMALPNLDGSFTMTLYLPRERFADLEDEPSLKSYFETEYADSMDKMPQYAEEYFSNPQGFLGTVRCSPWVYEDSVCLLGDAAHAIVPFFGQGMNLGFEDCYYLMKFFEEEKEWASTFKKFNLFQKPNAEAIANMALENAVEMSEKVGDPQFLLKKQIEHKMENHFPEKYRSRYGMVTYTLIPYATTYEAGLLQQEILDELSKGLENVDQLDLQKAEALVDEKFCPFLEKNAIDLSRYQA